MCFCRHFKAGATGLEPATSGVPGHFVGHTIDKDGCAIALFMLLFEALALRYRMVDQGTEFGRCCPFAAREAGGGSHRSLPL